MDETKSVDGVLDAIVTEAKRIEEDSLHSAKGHFEASAVLDRWNFWIGTPTTIVAAIAGVSALTDNPTIAAVLAFLVAASSALMTFLTPKERCTGHLRAGNLYNGLRNDARIFHSIQCRSGTGIDELQKILLDLNSRRNSLNCESPGIPRRAYERALRGIKRGEATYAADREKPTDQTASAAG